MVLLRTPRIHVYEVSLTTGELASLHMNVGFNIHKDANFLLVGIPPAQMDLGWWERNSYRKCNGQIELAISTLPVSHHNIEFANSI